MLKQLLIRNFLLLKYKRPKLISPERYNYSDEEKQQYLDCQDILFYRTIEQINYFHPKAHIHVLTNENLISTNNISYYIFNEVWSNLLCKFKLYSLINEPAMYVDLDVIFNKPLPTMCLYQKYPFYFFNVSWGENIKNYTNKKLPANDNITYNSGVTWINKPNKNLTDQLLELQEKYFNDGDALLAKNLWPYNDEHALSLLSSINKYKMPLSDSINVSRNKLSETINFDTIKNLQSVHYTGIKTKQKMIKEYDLYLMSKHHNDEKVKKHFNLGQT